MAKANATANIQQVNFRFNISDISKLNEVWSPEIVVQEVPWKIRARRNVHAADKWLSMCLFCSKKDFPPNWSHAASASIKLLSFNSKVNPIEQNITPNVFSDNGGVGFDTFIRWTDLFDTKKGYVKDDMISLDIEIIAAEAKEPNKSRLGFEQLSKSCEEGCMSTFRLTVTNIRTLMAVKSPQFNLRNIFCHLTLYKYRSKLSINMDMIPKNLLGCSNFTVQMTANLISSKGDSNRVQKVQQKNILYPATLAIRQFISWDEMLKIENGFITNDSIIIEIKIKMVNSDDVVPNASKRLNTSNLQNDSKTMKLECKICKKGFSNQDILSVPCGHLFCSACIIESMKTRKECPTCKARIASNGLRRILMPK